MNKIFLTEFNKGNISSTIHSDSSLEIIEEHNTHYEILLDGDEIISVPIHAIRDIHAYYCTECGTFAISDNVHGKMKYCECGKLGVDRTDYYTRLIGSTLPVFDSRLGKVNLIFNLRTKTFLDNRRLLDGIVSKKIDVEELNKYCIIFENKFDK